MNKSSSKVLNGILVLVGFIVISAILIWSPVCEKMIELANGNMTHMRCFYTGQASILLSIVLIVAGIESLFMNTRKPWTFIAIGILFLVVTSDSVLGIGLCIKETMPCHSTAVWIRGGGILTIICGLLSLVKGDTRQ
ncbi:hypothetical protein Curi_c20000 [Gottschalkia acidurici 9a]|uniref:DUF4418 domain-containing protein n=1 Tax=Gottschalkia acidurici (strain ATCC 7906 / DSM 604 / BCRC 14475 / CIP 104303 / KCTC 5404 / NCIMB 10678 / 9a) TaxID=1128398 RepID=K0B0E5_GOTA9|nr:DUF4418 family protein [Gottschalkia acidurici]AFS79004.1 hypothetical protein Curi_c20000 [Gottschalkia acidurici 9a]